MSKMDFTGIDFGMIDTGGKTIREGDVVMWRCDGESVVCHVKWNPSSFSFSLTELNGWDPMCEVTPIRRQGEYIRIGNESEFPGIVKKWRRLNDAEYGFIRQGEPEICFPIAVINSCVGAGIEKTYTNFNLLNKMIEAGLCRGWGGCNDEQGVLNTIQKSVNVNFVRTERMEDVIENGGVLTLKSGNSFHACAVFLIDDDPYLVNSNIGEGEFVRPLLDKSEICRSEDPENHRDYVIVVG
jgi:hypothetical protein